MVWDMGMGQGLLLHAAWGRDRAVVWDEGSCCCCMPAGRGGGGTRAAAAAAGTLAGTARQRGLILCGGRPVKPLAGKIRFSWGLVVLEDVLAVIADSSASSIQGGTRLQANVGSYPCTSACPPSSASSLRG